MKCIARVLVVLLSVVSMSAFASRQVGFFETEKAVRSTVVGILNSKDIDEVIRKEYWAAESVRREAIRKAEADFDQSFGELVAKNKNDVVEFEESTAALYKTLADAIATVWKNFSTTVESLDNKYKDQIEELMVTIEQQSELRIEEEKVKKVTKLKKD